MLGDLYAIEEADEIFRLLISHAKSEKLAWVYRDEQLAPLFNRIHNWLEDAT